jgi:hypothetical protein
MAVIFCEVYRVRQALSIFLVLAISLAGGCLSADLDFDMNPLYKSYPHVQRGTADQEAVVPFYYARQTPDSSEWGLRPLLGVRKFESTSRKECDFLPPFGRYVSEPNRTTARFWPLYWYTKTSREGEREDVDWILFPILFGGHSHDGEDYFAFFPLGGRIRNFLGMDKYDFFLWPLFQRVRPSATEDSVSTSFLLLVAWTEGGNRDGSYRILPFYMHRRWEGKYDKYSVLWPFFHYQETRKDKKHPATLYSFWPLFLHEHSDIHYRFGLIGPILFLGPLIQLNREIPELWEGEPNVAGNSYYLYDVPWPLVRVERKRDYDYLRILPFYAHYEEEGFDSKAYLIPLIWYRQEDNAAYEKTDFHFAPFFHTSLKTLAHDAGVDGYLQFWPLFHRSFDEEGVTDFSVLSLLPLRKQKFIRPVDEAFWPFWNVYRYRRDAWGASRHSALFGLITHYSAPEETRFSFPLLYSYHRTEMDRWRHDFLLGLLSIGGNDEGLKRFRFLFIPFLDQ